MRRQEIMDNPGQRQQAGQVRETARPLGKTTLAPSAAKKQELNCSRYHIPGVAHQRAPWLATSTRAKRIRSTNIFTQPQLTPSYFVRETQIARSSPSAHHREKNQHVLSRNRGASHGRAQGRVREPRGQGAKRQEKKSGMRNHSRPGTPQRWFLPGGALGAPGGLRRTTGELVGAPRNHSARNPDSTPS